MLAALSLAALFSLHAEARADEPAPDPDPPSADAWFGPDKALHFAVGTGLGGGGYALGALAFDNRWAGVGMGAGIGLVACALKEGLDAAGLGDPSWKDFVWGMLGTTLGLGVGITFDAALRGPLHD